jgi:hypothetical protein
MCLSFYFFARLQGPAAPSQQARASAPVCCLHCVSPRHCSAVGFAPGRRPRVQHSFACTWLAADSEGGAVRTPPPRGPARPTRQPF